MQAMPSLWAEAGVRWRTDCPAISIVPPSGWCAPVMTLMRLDLPAPFSPSSAWTSPARKSNDTPFNAQTAPNDFLTEVSWRSGRVIRREKKFHARSHDYSVKSEARPHPSPLPQGEGEGEAF